MKASWRDPDDTSPNASRYAREVSGWRSFCPLRRMMVNGTQIEQRHVLAADVLRLNADVAALGYASGRIDGVPVSDLRHGPLPGPSFRSVAQVKALIVYQGAMRLFPCPGQQRLIRTVILSNATLARWCVQERERLGRKVNPQIEMGRLLTILDALAAHFATDVEEALDRGSMLPV